MRSLSRVGWQQACRNVELACVTLFALMAPCRAWAQGDTVRVGSIRGLALPLGSDTSRTYLVQNGERRLVSTYVERVSRSATGDFVIVGRNLRLNGSVATFDSVVLQARTLAPMSHADSSSGGMLQVLYGNARLSGEQWDSAGGRRVIDQPVPPGSFDYSTAARVVNQLPLHPGYTAVVVSYDVRRGPQMMRVSVLGEEIVERTRGRMTPTWRVEVDYGAFTATRWIAKEGRDNIRVRIHRRGTEVVVEYP